MEQNEENVPVKTEELAPSTKAKKGFNIKILLFGIPLFAIQLAAVYYITANILLTKLQANNGMIQDSTEVKKDSVIAEKEEAAEFGKFVFKVEDVLANPAKTDGKRFLLSNLGIDVASEEGLKELEAKDVLLRDAIISVMGSKEMAQLSNIAYRDTLRTEVIKRIHEIMPNVKVNTIYFSKFILQ